MSLINNFNCHASLKTAHTQQFRKNENEIREEFDSMNIQRKNYQKKLYSKFSKIGRLQENKGLNRIKHLYPHDNTLVSVENGYINANFAYGHKYIQTEAPLQKTLKTFWEMIAKKNVKTIVMLNELSERTIFPYWPEKEGLWKSYGAVSVKVLGKEKISVPGKHKTAVIQQRKMLIKTTADGHPREITHLHYANWTDGKAPQEGGILKLISKVRKAQSKSKAPIAVHCFAGVGRTATFCLLDKGKQEIEKGKPFIIKKSVLFQRSPITGRSPFMFTKDQYVASHRILKNLHKKTPFYAGD